MIINLISGPRNVSTALMYSFAQRSDTEVIDEPFYGYYLKQTGIIHPGRPKILASMEVDIDTIIQQIFTKDIESKVLFLKNMAHHHIDIDLQFLLTAKNVFLIRHPKELIASFSKVIKNPNIDDIGLKKSIELYRLLIKEGQQPVILDSGELLKDPTLMLSRLCESLGIHYDPSMESWEAGPIAEDGIWAKYWYSNVHKSTGLVKSNSKEVEISRDLEPLCTEAMIYYGELFSHSIKFQ